MSKNILVDVYNLTKILTSIRKYTKGATSIDMLIDVAFFSTILGSLSNVGVFTLRVFFGTNHSYGWCHSFCSKVEYVL